MLQSVRSFLNRPIAEEFSFRNHVKLAWQGGLYVFVFTSLLSGSFSHLDRLMMTALVSVGVVGVVLLANVLIPKLVPAFYNEDRWTVGRHIPHVLLVLFLISCSNQLILSLLNVSRPSFGQMYFSVTVIGFFPIMLGVFVAEQRRLKRNLAHAQTLNEFVSQRAETAVTVAATPTVSVIQGQEFVQSSPIVLTSENGKERLSLQPDQLLYIESVGNYVDVHWLNLAQPQKTVLRSTLKEIADTLSNYPQFFRSHRAFLVNLKAVSQTEGNARGYQLTITGAEVKIPVSRSYLEAFDQRMTLPPLIGGPALS
ncbi:MULTISPECIES: LytR/AlgR family response regulator transcription factor [Spirosoma]|uniref:LytTR family transcriptional regulator n=1 Tax=Spirosoma liriopis TaxID=2937440 RepID=A0ABT0HRP1_9BACT|nr:MULTISPECIES: LytTR family DNA-binding domain-containing protein [Spirosoma]MCK8494288.1 LytTR family transcriptional regulator [Spirosoma liriopis]UHG89301.1 LytTR family transcriptional regulator [Spirosoma oryzicola]